MDLLKFCLSFCDLDFVHSNFKVIQYLWLTIAFKLVLSQSSQILLPLCNPAIPSLAVSGLWVNVTSSDISAGQLSSFQIKTGYESAYPDSQSALPLRCRGRPVKKGGNM